MVKEHRVDLEQRINGERNSSPRMGAIRRVVELGRTLQIEHSEIAELYREGMTGIEISHKLHIPETYQVTEEIGRDGVLKALGGHSGELHIEAYPGMIPSEERTLL